MFKKLVQTANQHAKSHYNIDTYTYKDSYVHMQMPCY